MTPAASAAQALAILRDPGQFQWYRLSMFLIVLFVYAPQAQHSYTTT